MVIMGTFLAAALLFVVFGLIRKALGLDRIVPLPQDEHPPAVEVAGESPAPPPPLPLAPTSWGGESRYAPPASPALPLPVPEPAAPLGRFRVPVSYYRLIDLPLIGLVFLVYFALTAMPGGEEIPLEKKFGPEVLVASIIFQLLLMGMVAAFVLWRVKLTEWLGLRWKMWPLAFAIAPLTVFFMWCLMGALHVAGWNGWLERSLGIESMQEAVKLLQEAKDPLVIALMAIAAVIVAPIAEEVIFRGYLYPAAKRFCGPVGAILFSSLVFAAAHGNVVALLPLFALAVILCLLYEFTGSIWACISVHFLFNAATVSIQLLARSGIVDIPAPE
jgi:membrane protease YdiL (CAAX protease family)